MRILGQFAGGLAAGIALVALLPVPAPAYLGQVAAWNLPTPRYIAARAITANGDEVYVAAGDERIYRFRRDGRLVGSWGGRGGTVGQFDGVMDLAWHPAGRLLVVDAFNRRVQEFTPDGVPTRQWTFPDPRAIAVAPDGGFFVATMVPFASPQLVKLSYEGSVVSRGDVAPIAALASPSPEQVFAAVSMGPFGRGFIWTYASSGQLLRRWTATERAGMGGGQFSTLGPRGLTVDGNGDVWVADPFNHRIQQFTGQGRFLRACGRPRGSSLLRLPDDVVAISGGTLYVADVQTIRVLGQVRRPAPSCDRDPPALISLVVAPARFRVSGSSGNARGGTKFRFRSSEPGQLVAVLFRRVRRAPSGRLQLLRAGTIRRAIRRGLNELRFSGRVAGRRLVSGSYLVEFTAADLSGNRSRPLRRSLTIIP
jgi:NHL repeat